MLDEAKGFWDAIASRVKGLIHSETKNDLRIERYDVTTAPNGTTIGVTKPFGSTELMLPYSQEVRDVKVGDPVLVGWWGSMSNAKVCYHADGFDGATYNQINITSGTHDLDDYKTPGLYYFSTGATLSNTPNGATNGWLEVFITDNGARVKQLWHRQGTVDTHMDFYARYFNSSSWSGWSQFLTQIDVRYKIYSRPSQLGLTNGSATLSSLWTALPYYSIFVGMSDDFSSGQTPVTYCLVEMIKGWSNSRAIIRAYASGGAEWESGLNSNNVPDGNWYRQFSTEDFQSGNFTATVPAHSYKDYTITFPRAFAHAPKVWFSFYTTTTSVSGGANMQISKIASATTTQQKVRVFNDDSSERSPNIHWNALDVSNGNR